MRRIDFAESLASPVPWAPLAIAYLLVASAGCHLLPREDPSEPLPPIAQEERPALIPWRKEEPASGVPAQIVATWTDTVLQESGKGATRGFGGRLYFYGHGDPTPISVEGQLVVYAFDETDRGPTDNKPTKRYVFPPDQFALHRSQSDLGTSYSFWLPWDKSNGAATDVSLIARFEPLKGGTLIVSDQTGVRLPGQYDGPRVVPQTQIAQRIEPPQPVRTVAHTEAIPKTNTTNSSKPVADSRIETTTIKLPQGTRAHRAVVGPATGSSGSFPPAAGPRRTTISFPGPVGAAQGVPRLP